MNKLTAILKLTRFEHSLMLVVAVVAAELLAKGLPQVPILLLSLISPVLISMGSFAINDYFDVEVDKLNKKVKRPLVNGALNLRQALYIAIATFVIGVAASAFINLPSFIVALVFAALAFLYSYRLKEMLLVGNVYIAFSMVIPFIYGSYVVGEETIIGGIVLISVMIFATGLAREINGTVRDFAGDVKARKLRSLPKYIGLKGAAVVSLILYLFAISISIYLFLYVTPFKANLAYAFMVAITDVLLLYVAAGYAHGKERLYERMRTLSLAAMTLALIAILLAPLISVYI